MTWGVIVFPGSNCDRDCVHALRAVLGQQVLEVWHGDQSLEGIDALVLPGGFSYGDYLRSGAVAATAAIMPAVRMFAGGGAPVLGICNGFQILTEAGLLPGTLMRNPTLRFRCATVWVRVESAGTPFTAALPEGAVLRMPIAHGEGGFLADPATVADLEASGRVVFRYCDARGRVTPGANPNGSIAGIAGVASVAGNVVGLMPHPERASEALLGSTDGRRLFESAIAYLSAHRAPAVGAAR
jgi:phosphoribosylformylglycinamidine synthase